MRIEIPINASLENPKDSTEVNVVAAIAGVGTTNRLASGQKITWTADFLRNKVKTFEGKPINVILNAQGKATDHSRRVVGAIKEAWFDEDQGLAWGKGALWPHYFPHTVEGLKKLHDNKDLNASMEFMYPGQDTLVANSDGSYSPTEGNFSGMGFVDKPGDPRSMVYLMAAMEKDEPLSQEAKLANIFKDIANRLLGKPEEVVAEEEQGAHEGSMEWVGNRLREHLRDIKPESFGCEVIATYSNYAIYRDGEDYYQINWKRSGGKLEFGEPQAVDPVYQPTAKASAEESGVDPAEDTGHPYQGEENDMSDTNPEKAVEAQAEAQAALAAKDEQIAELQASLEKMSTTLGEMKAAQDAKEADEKATRLADERMAELEKIVPVKEKLSDEAAAALHQNLKVLDDTAYEAVKATFAASAEIRAGIAPTDTIENPDPTPAQGDQKVSKEEQERYQAEAKAQFGSGLKSEDKE